MNEDTQQCPRCAAHFKKMQEIRRLGAKKVNETYTTDKRRLAGKKGNAKNTTERRRAAAKAAWARKKSQQ